MYLKSKSEHLIKELESCSIIRLTAPNQYSIHRLLQLVIKNRLSPQDRHHIAAQLIKTLHEELKAIVEGERWELSHLWLPHVPVVTSEFASTDMTLPRESNLHRIVPACGEMFSYGRQFGSG